MKISELIEYLQERLQKNGDLDIAVQDTTNGDICEITFDSQIALQRTPGDNKLVLAFSPTGDWTDWNKYSC